MTTSLTTKTVIRFIGMTIAIIGVILSIFLFYTLFFGEGMIDAFIGPIGFITFPVSLLILLSSMGVLNTRSVRKIIGFLGLAFGIALFSLNSGFIKATASLIMLFSLSILLFSFGFFKKTGIKYQSRPTKTFNCLCNYRTHLLSNHLPLTAFYAHLRSYKQK